MKQKNKFAEHLTPFILNTLPFIVSLVPSVIAVPLYLKYYGEENLGVYYLYITIVGIGSVFDLGISQTMVKYISEYKGKSKSYTSLIIDSSRIITIIIVIICILISAIGIFLDYTFELFSWNNLLSILFVMGFSFQFFLNFELSIKKGFENFSSIVKFEIAQKIVFTCLGIGIAIYYQNIYMLLVAHILVTALLYLKVAYQSERSYRYLNIKDLGKNVVFFKRNLLNYSKWVIVQNAVGFLNSSLDKFILASFLNVKSLASYSTSQNLTGLFQGFLAKGLSYILPYSSRINDTELLRRFFVRGNVILSCFLGIVYVIALNTCPFLIKIYLKNDLEVANKVIEYFDLMLISSLFNSTSLLSWHIFNGMGKVKINTVIPLIFNAIGIVLVCLGGYFYGVWGVIIAKLIGSTFSVIVRTITYNKVFEANDVFIGIKLVLPLVMAITGSKILLFIL